MESEAVQRPPLLNVPQHLSQTLPEQIGNLTSLPLSPTASTRPPLTPLLPPTPTDDVKPPFLYTDRLRRSSGDVLKHLISKDSSSKKRLRDIEKENFILKEKMERLEEKTEILSKKSKSSDPGPSASLVSRAVTGLSRAKDFTAEQLNKGKDFFQANPWIFRIIIFILVVSFAPVLLPILGGM